MGILIIQVNVWFVSVHAQNAEIRSIVFNAWTGMDFYTKVNILFYFRYIFINFQGSCVTLCPYGYYSSQNKCLLCDQSCLLCADSSTNCLACKNNLFMHAFYLNNFTMSQSICSTECPEGYFRDQSSSNYDNMCQKCSPNCKTCNGSKYNCTSCNEGKILYDE